jgi:hypothetical protein
LASAIRQERREGRCGASAEPKMRAAGVDAKAMLVGNDAWTV